MVLLLVVGCTATPAHTDHCRRRRRRRRYECNREREILCASMSHVATQCVPAWQLSVVVFASWAQQIAQYLANETHPLAARCILSLPVCTCTQFRQLFKRTHSRKTHSQDTHSYTYIHSHRFVHSLACSLLSLSSRQLERSDLPTCELLLPPPPPPPKRDGLFLRPRLLSP